MRRATFISALAVSAVATSIAQAAVVTYSSGSNFINSPLVSSFPPVVVAEGTANVTVFSSVTANGSGTDDPAFLAQGNASISVVGGILTAQGSGANGTKPRAGIRLLDNSRLTLISGTIEGDGSGVELDRAGILAEGNSQVTMLGGSVIASGSGLDSSDTFGIRALGNAQISILGGTISASTFPNSTSTVLSAADNSRFTIFGSNFNFPLGAIAPLSGTLTGKLQDGTPISWTFTHTATSSITIVPEPSTIVLLTIGFCSIIFRRKTR